MMIENTECLINYVKCLQSDVKEHYNLPWWKRGQFPVSERDLEVLIRMVRRLEVNLTEGAIINFENNDKVIFSERFLKK